MCVRCTLGILRRGGLGGGRGEWHTVDKSPVIENIDGVFLLIGVVEDDLEPETLGGVVEVWARSQREGGAELGWVP